MKYILIYFAISFLLTIYALFKTDVSNKRLIGSILFSPIIVLYLFLETIFDFKIYKTYFDKSDTPFRQDFQPNKKYHIVWKRNAYTKFFNHKVIKVKKYGIFTIYESEVKKDV
jgi:hypothetical protein